MANLDIQPPSAGPSARLPLGRRAARRDVAAAEINAVLSLPDAPWSDAGWRDAGRGDDRWLSYRRLGKRALDLTLVLAFLPVYLPFVALAALLLFVEGGNPFYRQDRLGRDGARFSIVKLRTMVRDADKKLEDLLRQDPEMRREWEVSQKLRSDPRITRIGAILRRSSMDELPQLWNVLIGQMSLVGPRPMMPEQLPLYGDPQDYFAVRPGITGLWQVDRRNDSSFADRARYDTAYRRELSLVKDLRVLWQTIGVVLKRTGC